MARRLQASASGEVPWFGHFVVQCGKQRGTGGLNFAPALPQCWNKPYKNSYSTKQFGKRSTGRFIYVLGKMGGEDISLQVYSDRAPSNAKGKGREKARANKREETLESRNDLSFEKTMHLYKWGKQALNTGDEGIIVNLKVEINRANICKKTLGSYLNRAWAKEAQALRANRQSGLSSMDPARCIFFYPSYTPHALTFTCMGSTLA